MKLKLKETLTKLLDTTPIGKIVMYAGSSAPRGWLLCQGQAVSRTTYAKLFSVIGTTYGSGDGSTTFNLPDMRGRVPTGVGTCDGITYNRGDKKDAGIPNITGKFSPAHSSGACWYNALADSGAFTASDTVSNCGIPVLASTFSGTHCINIDASRSSAKYGKSSTVQPNTTVFNFIIYVGGGSA